MRVGVVGINYKLADLKLRELLAKACQRRFSSDCSMHFDHAFVLLSTCNRTEIYFCSEDLAHTHTYLLSILRNEIEQEFDQKLYSYFGLDCFQHLCRVTAGLDSAIVAETEIQGQVKAAYEKAVSYSILPSEIHFLFQKSLKIGKKVRGELPSKPGLPDLEHAIFSAGIQLFNECRRPKILFVGASDINLKILNFLKMRKYLNITLCNRTLQNALEVQKKFQIDLLSWNKIGEWPTFDWIIFGTKSPDYLISQKDIQGTCIEKKLVIDLCVPRNVDPRLAKEEKLTLLNIDQINRSLKIRRQHLNNVLVQVENTIQQASTYHVRQFKMRENNIRMAV